MFGNTYFGIAYFGPGYFGPAGASSGGGGGSVVITSPEPERPRLTTFFGQAGGPRIIKSRTGATDLDTAYAIYAKSRVLAPAGVDGEALFTALYLTLSWTATASLLITPIVDGIPYDGVDATDERKPLTLTSRATRKTQTFVLPLVRRLTDPRDSTVTVARFYLRGGRFQVLIESVGALTDGDVILEACAVEAEPMTDTKDAS
jgi:hypothetical protein